MFNVNCAGIYIKKYLLADPPVNCRKMTTKRNEGNVAGKTGTYSRSASFYDQIISLIFVSIRLYNSWHKRRRYLSNRRSDFLRTKSKRSKVVYSKSTLFAAQSSEQYFLCDISFFFFFWADRQENSSQRAHATITRHACFRIDFHLLVYRMHSFTAIYRHRYLRVPVVVVWLATTESVSSCHVTRQRHSANKS